MPVTICSNVSSTGTAYPQQIRIFRNPRGLKYYYALITLISGLDLYKSADGVTWTYVAHILFGEAFIACSVDLYDDGTQLIVYMTYGWDAGYKDYSNPIAYRRMRIADDASNPTIGAEQLMVSANRQGVPVIKRDRNGYVHIAFMRMTIDTIKGKEYNHPEPMICGTTTTNPSDAPTWTAPTLIEDYPNIGVSRYRGMVTMVVFGGTGDIGGLVYQMDNSAGVLQQKGRDIVSFNGATYSLGTATAIVSAVDDGEAIGLRTDGSNYAHLLYRTTTVNQRICSKKSSSASTVESWASAVVVDGTNNVISLECVALSINRTASPNVLYAFYRYSTSTQWVLRYRTSPVDTVSWSTEKTIDEGSLILTYPNPSESDQVNSIHVMYRHGVGNARYVEISTLAMIEKSGSESYSLTESGISINILIPKSGSELYSLTELGVPINILMWKSDSESYLLAETGEVYVVPIAVDKYGTELFAVYEVSGEMKYPSIMPKVVLPVPIAVHSGIEITYRGGEAVSERKTRKFIAVPTKRVSEGKNVRVSLKPIAPRYGFKVIRNGETIYKRWKGKDLLVWRGQMSLAHLISQGSVGSAVGAFRLIISENADMPDMGDDSGDPEANEFSPIIGTPVTGTWTFEPTVKPSGQYPLSGWLYYEGDITADRNATVRKMGIIDTTAIPNRRIVTEDRVIDFAVLLNDIIRIRYWFPLG